MEINHKFEFDKCLYIRVDEIWFLLYPKHYDILEGIIDMDTLPSEDNKEIFEKLDQKLIYSEIDLRGLHDPYKTDSHVMIVHKFRPQKKIKE